MAQCFQLVTVCLRYVTDKAMEGCMALLVGISLKGSRSGQRWAGFRRLQVDPKGFFEFLLDGKLIWKDFIGCVNR